MAQDSMKGTKAFQDTIAHYLQGRAENDPILAIKLANPSKTMEQCCQFIINQATSFIVLHRSWKPQNATKPRFYWKSRL